MSAVKNNNSALVQQLIQNGANVDELDPNLDAPLIIAAYKGYTHIVRLLLEAGADVSAVDPEMKATALHAAAFAGNTETAKLLVQYHVDINKQGPKNGHTALHDAIWQGHLETVRVLLDAGASLTIQSHLGETPLMFAKAKHHAVIVNLIEHKTISTNSG
jgi:ankyrin repeat protein